METIRNILVEPFISPQRVELVMFLFKILGILVLAMLGTIFAELFTENMPLNDEYKYGERQHVTETIFFTVLEIITSLTCVLILALYVLH